MRSATAYPKFVFGFFVVLTLGIFFFLIPRFSAIFADLNTKLPPLTVVYIATSTFLRQNILILLPAVVGLYVLYRYFLYTERGGEIIDRFVLKIPFFGSLLLKAAIERLAVTTGTLLSNGIPLTDALHISCATLNNVLLEGEIRDVRTNVMKGFGLAESLARAQHMPRLLARMVHVGEESGTLSEMFEEVASYYEEEVDRALGRITSVIEPIIICGMGAIVLTTLLALYLPIFGLSAGARGG